MEETSLSFLKELGHPNPWVTAIKWIKGEATCQLTPPSYYITVRRVTYVLS